VCTRLPDRDGRIVFLGDDDLVSPLVAALAPRHEVVVCDIDPIVLEESEAAAQTLNASLTTISVDFQDPQPAAELEAELAIADPFPSGDGAFEGFFWEVATRALVEDGRLISTISPSHKPRDYRQGALRALEDLEFELLETRADQSRYEVFDFELARLELRFLDHLGQTPGLSHTKDVFLAARRHGKPPGEPPPFTYSHWQEATEGHYLNSFARRAGGGARCGIREIADDDREPTLDELWELAHQSWTRPALERAPAALS
jgi:branched-chain polyamine synthase A-like protein